MLRGEKEKEEKKYQASKERFFGFILSKYRSLIDDGMDFLYLVTSGDWHFPSRTQVFTYEDLNLLWLNMLVIHLSSPKDKLPISRLDDSTVRKHQQKL